MPGLIGSDTAIRARLAYGLPIVAVGLAAYAVTGADRVSLKLLIGAGSVGAYSRGRSHEIAIDRPRRPFRPSPAVSTRYMSLTRQEIDDNFGVFPQS